MDLAAKRVIRGDGDVRLTPTEWQLLEILVRNENRLVTQKQLLQEVWGPQYQTEANYLRVYVAHLRRKLEPDPSRPRYLLTEPGMGYRFRSLSPALGPRGPSPRPSARAAGLELVAGVVDGPLVLDLGDPPVHRDLAARAGCPGCRGGPARPA